MIKNSLFGGMQFEFVNRVTGKTVPHKVGHTVTTETGSGGFTDFLSTKSRFKPDSRTVWDVLHEAGMRISNRMSSDKLGMTCEVKLKGRPLATLASTTPASRAPFATT